MATRIDLRKPLPEEIRRVAIAQVERARLDLAGADDDLPAAVHEVRKRTKETRALLRLVRDAMPRAHARDNAALRDMARRLAPLRDVGARLEALDRIAVHARDDEVDAIGPVRDALGSIRAETGAPLDPENVRPRLEGVGAELDALRRRIDDWPVGRIELGHLVTGLRRTYARGRAGLAAVDSVDDVAGWHAARKRIKYLLYHHRFLRRVWPAMMHTWQAELDELGEWIGEHHDLSLLSELLPTLPIAEPAAAAVARLVARRRQVRHGGALSLGARIYAETPRRFGRRMAAYLRLATE